MATIPQVRDQLHAKARALREEGYELIAMSKEIDDLAEATKRIRRPKAPGKRCPISAPMRAQIIRWRGNHPTWTIHQITEHFKLRNNRAVSEVLYGKRT